jgi:hypothetical protein
VQSIETIETAGFGAREVHSSSRVLHGVLEDVRWFSGGVGGTIYISGCIGRCCISLSCGEIDILDCLLR